MRDYEDAEFLSWLKQRGWERSPAPWDAWWENISGDIGQYMYRVDRLYDDWRYWKETGIDRARWDVVEDDDTWLLKDEEE